MISIDHFEKEQESLLALVTIYNNLQKINYSLTNYSIFLKPTGL